MDRDAESRWLSLGMRLGAPDAEARAAFRELVRRYAEPHRAYHTLEHVLDCQRELDRCRELAADVDALEAALWFHDAVYDPRRSGNEEASAALAQEILRHTRMHAERLAGVGRLILATRHDAVQDEGDAALIVDIDLAILGSGQERFDRYEEAIRREFAWVPELVFRSKRALLLEGFLRRSPLFVTDLFRDSFEARARQNLARSIARLRREP